MESSIKRDKQRLRESMWRRMEKEKVVLFPGAYGRIPNFKGREETVSLIKDLDAWRRAKFIKSNPDSPQQVVREESLRNGKIIYMAVPKLRDERCFVKILPDMVDNYRFASTIKGAFIYGTRIYPDDLPKVDLILAGSVVVNMYGERIGKGGGYSDLEYAILKTFKKVDESTPILTTVHEIQIVDHRLPREPHDILVDYIVTPERIIKTRRNASQPDGIMWEYISERMLKSIPILRRLKK